MKEVTTDCGDGVRAMSANAGGMPHNLWSIPYVVYLSRLVQLS